MSSSPFFLWALFFFIVASTHIVVACLGQKTRRARSPNEWLFRANLAAIKDVGIDWAAVAVFILLSHLLRVS
jgi:hypothetical protein